jgi:uncharacterized membrane protein YphA (DoxX/SURF4 family)
MIVLLTAGALIRAGSGLLFLAAGASKLLRWRSVRHTVMQYRLLPSPGAGIFAWLIVPAELTAGALLMCSLWLPVHTVAWAIAGGLLALFSIAIGSALIRGIFIPCGCGWLLGNHTITPAALARNLLLIAALSADFAFRSWR